LPPILPLSAGIVLIPQAIEQKKKENAMTPEQTAHSEQQDRAGQHANLDRQYGNIGISAVAAALRYQGGGKNPAYAPAPRRDNERVEAAA
jgi:hypothetical protein